jgi:uncharacterized lipoprotein YajG
MKLYISAITLLLAGCATSENVVDNTEVVNVEPTLVVAIKTVTLYQVH